MTPRQPDPHSPAKVDGMSQWVLYGLTKSPAALPTGLCTEANPSRPPGLIVTKSYFELDEQEAAWCNGQLAYHRIIILHSTTLMLFHPSGVCYLTISKYPT